MGSTSSRRDEAVRRGPRSAQLAATAIADIRARGKRALVVGGTGLYVRCAAAGALPGAARGRRAVRPRCRRSPSARDGAAASAASAASIPSAAARIHPNDRVTADPRPRGAVRERSGTVDVVAGGARLRRAPVRRAGDRPRAAGGRARRPHRGARDGDGGVGIPRRGAGAARRRPRRRTRRAGTPSATARCARTWMAASAWTRRWPRPCSPRVALRSASAPGSAPQPDVVWRHPDIDRSAVVADVQRISRGRCGSSHLQIRVNPG